MAEKNVLLPSRKYFHDCMCQRKNNGERKSRSKSTTRREQRVLPLTEENLRRLQPMFLEESRSPIESWLRAVHKSWPPIPQRPPSRTAGSRPMYTHFHKVERQ